MKCDIGFCIGLLVGYVVSKALSMYTLENGEEALIVDRNGVKKHVRGKGDHFFIPWLDTVVIYLLEQVRTTRVICKDCDDEKVVVSAVVGTHIESKELPTLYKNLGIKYMAALESITKNTVESVVSKYTAKHLALHKEDVMKEVEKELRKRAEAVSVSVDRVVIPSMTVTV